MKRTAVMLNEASVRAEQSAIVMLSVTKLLWRQAMQFT